MKKAILLIFFTLFLFSFVSAQTQYINSCRALDQPNTTYVLTQDVSSADSCFFVYGDNITLDLNGHKITYATGSKQNSCSTYIGTVSGNICHYAVYNSDNPTTIPDTPAPYNGRWNLMANNFTLKNGIIGQGNGGASHSTAIYWASSNAEFANLTVTVNGNDSDNLYTTGSNHIHHNNFINESTVVTNRHQGREVIYSSGTDSLIHDNKIVGGPQNGIRTGSFLARSTAKIYRNDIRHNAVVTNPYGITVLLADNYEVYDNNIIPVNGRGIMLWESHYGKIYNNYIEVKDLPNGEYAQGLQSTGIRLRQGASYNKIYNNTIIAIAGEPYTHAIGLRPSTVYSSPTYNEFYDNNVTAITTSPNFKAEAVSIEQPLPMTYPSREVFRNNILTSNNVNIALGEYDGGAMGVEFISNKLIKGSNPINYNMITVGYDVVNVSDVNLLDSTFENGASYNNVLFQGTGAQRIITIQWYLDILVQNQSGTPLSGAVVSIKDSTGATVFSGTTDATGKVRAILTQYTQNPSGKTYFTPHTVTATYSSVSTSSTIIMDSSKSITLTLNLTPCTSGQTRACSIAHQGVCAVGTETCVSGSWTGCPAPQTETCNNLDDDCDSLIDEFLSRSCSVAHVGACAVGTESCSAGSWNGCPVPTAEVCSDSIDQNCDGSDTICSVCPQGQITFRCLCGSTAYSSGYCCNNAYQTTPCGTQACVPNTVCTTSQNCPGTCNSQGTLCIDDQNDNCPPQQGNTLTFQEGDGGNFSTTYDSSLRENSPNNGSENLIRIHNLPIHGIIVFPNIIGNSAGQLLPNSVIVSAELSFYVESVSTPAKTLLFSRVIDVNNDSIPLADSISTWVKRNNSSNWINAGGDYTNEGSAEVVVSTAGNYVINVTSTVQYWVNNYSLKQDVVQGWIIKYKAGEGDTYLRSSEHSNQTTRPKLTVNYSLQQQCIPDWQCGSWSQCLNGSQTRNCTDLNACDPNNLIRIESQACGSCTSGQTQSCTTESCAGTQTCSNLNVWGSCVKQDLCCGVSCSDGSDCTTDSCSAGQCSFSPIPNCGTGRGGGGGSGGGGGLPSQKEFLVELNPSQVKIGENFTVTVKDSSSRNTVENASVSYAKNSKFTSILGIVEFTAVQGYSLVTVKKDGYKNNTVRITIVTEPVSLCGNYVCDLGESHGNCASDCPAGKKLRVSTEKASVSSGETLNVVVTDENGNSVDKAKVVYAGKSYLTDIEGLTSFTAVKGYSIVTASKEGFEPASTILKFITAVKPECGNNKCDEGETAESCPRDCKQEIVDLMPFTAAGIALILIVLFVVIVIKEKNKISPKK
ncbi:MAG: NosD domain-containing protein [Candidatus Diapherotrites archaeon]